jgi:hypothetical protein
MKTITKYTAAAVACVTPFALAAGGAVWLLEHSPMVLQTVGMVAMGAAGAVSGYFLATAVID